MAYTDTIFNDYGKIPTDSNFWNQSIDQFVSDSGFTSGFRRVLGEQVFKSNKEIRTPFYSRFAGKPIDAGVGWTERALYDSGVKRWNPKATAEDALGYYDSKGIEKSFTVNVQMWKPVSVPSDLASLDDFIARNGIGELNSRIVDTVTRAYQNAIESEIQKKAISLTKNSMDVDIETDGIVKVFGQIMDKATEMMSDDYHYNELSDDENADLITRSDKIYMFVNQKYLNAYRNAKANLPSPSELVSNVEIIPMLNDLAKPLHGIRRINPLLAMHPRRLPTLLVMVRLSTAPSVGLTKSMSSLTGLVISRMCILLHVVASPLDRGRTRLGLI